MRYVINKSLDRQYSLMKLLFLEDKPVSKHRAAEIVGCSRPTLDSMIENVKHTIGEYGRIFYSDGGLQLEIADNFSLRHVQAIILKETFLYQFLMDLLFDEVTSIEQWANDHFVSTSFSYKHLKQVTTFFSEMDIRLDTSKSTISLVGNEWQIRYLYFLLLKENALVDEQWPFKTLPYPAVKSFVRKICRELDVYVSPLIEYQYCLFIGVHVMRSQKITDLQKQDYDHDFWHTFSEKHELEPIFDKLSESLNLELDENNRFVMFRSIECFPVRYLSSETVLERLYVGQVLTKTVYNLAYEFMSLLEGRPDNDPYQFAQYLHVLSFFHFLPFQNEIVFEVEVNQEESKIRKEIIQMVAEKTTPILNRLRTEGTEDYVLYNLDAILYRFGLIYQNYKDRDKPKIPVNVTVLSEYGFDKEQSIAGWLCQLFPGDTVQVLDNKDVNLLSGNNNIDIVVADYAPSELQKYNYYFIIDEYFSQRTREKLERKVKQLFYDKNKATANQKVSIY